MEAPGPEAKLTGGWSAGLRVGVGLAVGSFALAVTLGTYAVRHGWPPWLIILMSAVTFSGSAQFALVTGMAGGGPVAAALAGAFMMNLRFLPMAAATTPFFGPGRLRRALQAQAVVDGSWVAAQRRDGSLDVEKLFGATAVQLPAWTLGTALGALAAPSAQVYQSSGLDVIFPAFFVLLLVDAMRARRSVVRVSVAAAVLAIAACRVAAAGPALLVGVGIAVLAAGRRKEAR